MTDPTDTWHLMFRQAACTVTHDSGESWFNELFAKSVFVRYDRMDEDSGEVVPCVLPPDDAMPQQPVPYDLLLNAWHAVGTSGNVQDEDWRAYSTEDALADVNAWTTCDYSERTKRGFLRRPVWRRAVEMDRKRAAHRALRPCGVVHLRGGSSGDRPTEKFRGLVQDCGGTRPPPRRGRAGRHQGRPRGLHPVVLGVSQHAPAAAWEHGVQDALDEAVGFTWHWWHHSGSIAALKAKDSYPDNPDGSGGAGQRAAGTDGGSVVGREDPTGETATAVGCSAIFVRTKTDSTFYISGDDDMEL